MALLKNGVVSMALLAVSLGAGALKADDLQGRFNLPFDAQWGKITLQAGEYTISVPTSTSWPQIISLSGNGKTVYIMAASEGLAPVSADNCLKIENVGNLHVVREFDSGLQGETFTFKLPKTVQAQMAAAKTSATQVAVMIRK